MRKRSNPSARAQMNTSHSLTSHYLIGNDLWTWRGFDLFGVSCIECYSSCKVWEVGKLGCNEWWVVGGIYSPNHQKSRWWRLLSHGLPDSPVRQPCHPTVGASVFWATGQSDGAPDRSCRLSGVPSSSALTSGHCSALIAAADDR